ncbi:MAG: helix-turn-helix transcriptional regulator [Bacteroidota bacterium]|nr:helix-turn-helix transcriptional regulator [Bacteroidota bacterium]
MKRDKVLRSPNYWLVQWQNDLYGVINKYMKNKNINRSQLAKELHVTKGYVTQILNGDFNHKINKLIELSLACGKIPIVNYIDLENYIKEDAITTGSINVSNTKTIDYHLSINSAAPFHVNKESIKTLETLIGNINSYSASINREAVHG